MGLKQLKERATPSNARKKAVPPKSSAPAEPKTTTSNARQPREKKEYHTGLKTEPKLSDAAKALIQKAETTEQVQEIIDSELPKGYTAIGRNDFPKLMKLKEELITKGIASFDYETTGDTEDDTQDPQDHEIVGVSFAHTIGQAFYMPIMHDAYGANWEVEWFVQNFLKPILEHPDVIIIAHNIQFEHQISLLYGIDMYPKALKRKVRDTMLMVKALGLPQTINAMGEVIVGLKPSTKSLLADENGVIHGLLKIDEVKSFKEMVTLQVQNGVYKSGKNKGLPKFEKKMITFNQRPVDQDTIDYGCSDSDWALGLNNLLHPLMEAEDLLDTFYELNMPFVMVLGEYELTGWHTSKERLQDMERIARLQLDGYIDDKTGEEVDGLEQKLYDALCEITVDQGLAELDDDGMVVVPAGRYPMGKWKGEHVFLDIKNGGTFNWGSTNHKVWLFFHILKIPTEGLERSKTTGIPSTGKDNLEKIIEDYDGDSGFMKVMKEKAKYDKILSTYVNGLQPFIREESGKIHTNLKLVQTWRLSSSKPNLQNIPRADNDPLGIRGVFTAPVYDLSSDFGSQNIFTRPPEIMYRENLSGKTMFIACDYSQIELKVLAWYAMERDMIATLANGGDLHSVVAQQVFKLPCEVHDVKKLYKPFRYRAKKVNFGIVYGMTEFGLSKDRQMGMTKDEAKQFINNYYATYPGIRTYAHDQIAFAREMGYVQTMFGNRRPIPDINSSNKWIRQSAENKAMNTPIQGSAGDIIRRAMVAIKNRARIEAPFIRQVMQIHDELIIETPVEYAAEAARWVKMVMEDPIDGFSDIMPIIAEPAVGAIWQHALDVSWDANGQAYVKPKQVKKEATDVTLDEMRYALPLYEAAGIEVRVG